MIRCPSCGSKDVKIYKKYGQPIFYCNTCQTTLTHRELKAAFKQTQIRSFIEAKLYSALKRAVS
ncbi:hypothetical protein SAMN04244560_00857 [Thermoanaerobacter thermohydrosulfuricus]|uniref:Uncharacterized protein n=1 Tax=Thermoanaerobacter thermohydrosulfuricus TaxID=1516 RepID=A0A1G7LRJ7_THETY|nr:hypothetical protein [Thermoanaerobacter thermohydrosulfuricus]SDF52142.1 hypothetical protein SAMN04244560_00857 [Thermoanaerobacter thermohydrosulfuricus]